MSVELTGQEIIHLVKVEKRQAWLDEQSDKFTLTGKHPKNDNWKDKYKGATTLDSEPYKLPKGWGWASAEEICSSVRDGTHNTPKYVDAGIPLITSKNLIDGELNFSNVKYISPEDHAEISMRSSVNEEDVLYAMIGTIGNPVVVKKNQGFSIKNVALFKSNPPALNPKYLKYWLDSPKFNYWLIPRLKGTTQKFAPLGLLRSLPVPVTAQTEQKLIVAKIEELFSHIDAGIAALNKSKKLLKQYRQSVLKAAVTGELTKQWREENKEKLEPANELLERILIERRKKWEARQMAQFKAKGEMPKNDKWKEKYKEPLKYNYEGELPKLPNLWTWASPEELASTEKYSLAIGPFGSNLKVSDYKEEGVPLIFVRNIRSHNYNIADAKFVTSDKAEALQAHSISGGDILITKMGEPPGDASLYPHDSPDGIITADCIKWRFNQMLQNPELYVHIINSSLIKSQIIGRTKGVAQKKISLGTFKSIAFPVPPITEQRQILHAVETTLDSITRLQTEIESKLLKAEKTKQSILAAAFSGKLV